MENGKMYQKGIETRERIIASAKKLFYEHGYNKTTIKMITIDAGVSLSAIPYYFNKKEEIIREIYHSFLSQIYDFLDEQLDERPDAYLMHYYASKIYYRNILNDDNNARFYYEVSVAQSNYNLLNPFMTEIYAKYAKDFNVELTDKQKRFIRMADAGARREVLFNYYNKLDDITTDELTDFLTSVVGTLIGIHTSVAERYMALSAEFVDELDYSHLKFLV